MKLVLPYLHLDPTKEKEREKSIYVNEKPYLKLDLICESNI